MQNMTYILLTYKTSPAACEAMKRMVSRPLLFYDNWEKTMELDHFMLVSISRRF